MSYRNQYNAIPSNSPRHSLITWNSLDTSYGNERVERHTTPYRRGCLMWVGKSLDTSYGNHRHLDTSYRNHYAYVATHGNHHTWDTSNGYHCTYDKSSANHYRWDTSYMENTLPTSQDPVILIHYETLPYYDQKHSKYEYIVLEMTRNQNLSGSKERERGKERGRESAEGKERARARARAREK